MQPDCHRVAVTTLDLYESGALHDVEMRLIAMFTPPLRAEQVRRCLFDAASEFADAVVRVYLPVLIERAATARLQRLVRDDSTVASACPQRGLKREDSPPAATEPTVLPRRARSVAPTAP